MSKSVRTWGGLYLFVGRGAHRLTSPPLESIRASEWLAISLLSGMHTGNGYLKGRVCICLISEPIVKIVMIPGDLKNG